MGKKWVVGNWKMHGCQAFTKGWAEEFQACCRCRISPPSEVHTIVCPFFPYLLSFLSAFADNSEPLVHLGAQNCRESQARAYTGSISASMLKDVGCEAVIVGHSERRRHQQEGSPLIQRKIQEVCKAGLTAVVCVGETEQAHKAGKELSAISEQLDQSIPPQTQALAVAYEPLWAIGMGATPSASRVVRIHQFIKKNICKAH